MKNIYFYLFIGSLLCTSINANAQNSYFFNQKNLFSVHASFNPRLIPMSQDNKGVDNFGTADAGIGRGTFYQYYNDDNELIGGNEKVNLMLNTSYGRLFGGNNIIGVEFNYQKHYLTMSENSNMGYTVGLGYDEDFDPFLISTPIFNVYDLQLVYGYFTSGTISPNKHLFSFGAGVRIFSLDQDHNYRKDAATPFTDLSNFMEGYDENFMFIRLSMNYTYRILITKNLSFDIGLNANLGLTLNMDQGEGYKPGPGNENGPAFERYYVNSKLGAETFFNILYFRTGFSFAI